MNVATKRKIKISSPDLGALLIDFLSEVLYLIQTNKEIYTNINFKRLTDTELEGELMGRETKRFGEDIKAVTYHGLKIEQKPARNASHSDAAGKMAPGKQRYYLMSEL